MAQVLKQVASSAQSNPGPTLTRCRSQSRGTHAFVQSSPVQRCARCRTHASAFPAVFGGAFGSFSKTPLQVVKRPQNVKRAKSQIVKAAADSATELEKGSNGPPVQLGTAELPEDINLPKLKQLLYQWANSIVTSSALPLPLPLKVDSLDNGVRLAFIRIDAGEISELFRIDVLLTPKAEGERRPMFKVFRDGEYKNQKAAFEPQVMNSLLAALKKSVPLSRGE